MADEIWHGRTCNSFSEMAFLQYEFYDSKKHFIDMQEEIETK